MTPQDLTYIIFLFALGACVGSFLNVVVYRVPRNESLISPGSHCPRCNTPLAWYDNLPVIGWLKLRGKCRYCKLPISARYPIVEATCGGLFVFYYVMFFICQRGPSETRPLIFPDGTMYVGPVRSLLIATDWPIYALDMFLVASLLAASLIDAELFIIPVGIPWLAAIIGIVGHTLIDDRNVPGALILLPEVRALAAGGGVGFLISVALWWWGIFPQSFSQGEPMLEVDRAEKPSDLVEPSEKSSGALDYHGPEMTKKEIFAEIRKEILFLMPPMAFAIGFWVLTSRIPAIGSRWNAMSYNHFVGGFLGSVFGALIGGLVVWLTRILGTLGFGRVAMGLGDVHLMFGVGAIIGAGASTVAFFIAPFFGIVVAVYFLLTRSKRELPYGPYLSMAVGVVLLFYNPIAAYLTPGFEGLGMAIRSLIGAS